MIHDFSTEETSNTNSEASGFPTKGVPMTGIDTPPSPSEATTANQPNHERTTTMTAYTAIIERLDRLTNLLDKHGEELPCDELNIDIYGDITHVIDVQVCSHKSTWLQRCAIVDQLADICEVYTPSVYSAFKGSGIYTARSEQWHIYAVGELPDAVDPHHEEA